MKHNPVKTFFTRGFLGRIFRPILYSKIDRINFEFMAVINETIKEIEEKIHTPNKGALYIWFSVAPLQLFELLFLPNIDNRTVVPILEKAEINNGKECAYLTQGFMLFHLEQILNNSPEYVEKIKTSIGDLDNMCNIVFGENNRVLKYLTYFRNKLDRSIIDPRDESIIYVYRVAELFIPDNNRKKIALKNWDDGLIGKIYFVNNFINFIITQKENSIKMID